MYRPVIDHRVIVIRAPGASFEWLSVACGYLEAPLWQASLNTVRAAQKRYDGTSLSRCSEPQIQGLLSFARQELGLA